MSCWTVKSTTHVFEKNLTLKTVQKSKKFTTFAPTF